MDTDSIQEFIAPNVADPRRFGSPTPHAVRAGHYVFVSGMLGWDIDRRVVARDVESQAARAIENIDAILQHAGGSLKSVVKLTFYLVDIRHKEGIWQVRKGLFGDHHPASTLVEISKLVDPDALLEVDAIAFLP